MIWENKKPFFGDQIRVGRGFYAHHGIYASDDCVIHFAPPGQTDTLDPSKARIITTSLSEFLQDGTLEVRSYSQEECEQKRTPSEVVNCALMHLGEGGYDLISNNCEHFSNECVFGSKKSGQIDKIFSKLFGGVKK